MLNISEKIKGLEITETPKGLLLHSLKLFWKYKTVDYFFGLSLQRGACFFPVLPDIHHVLNS